MDNGASSYRRFLSGEESAFDEIIKTYRDNLIFFINRYVHDLNAAEDIAIDAFMDLLVHRHRYHGKTTFKTYLFMIGRSRALDFLRKKNREQTIPISEAETALPPVPSPEEDAFQNEAALQLNNAMQALPEEMRVAVHLIYFEELSYADTARVMKKTRKQVDNLLYRAKNELRAILGKEGEFLL